MFSRYFSFVFLFALIVSPSYAAQSIPTKGDLEPNPEISPIIDIRYTDQIFLTATRSPQKTRRVTDNVKVITREELDRWPVGDLDEALGMINGIVVQDDGHLGQVATAQIYGSKPREVRVLIDGITMNPTTSGGIADLSQIPLDIVEKIEVIKGASSSVWGSAMGGVINIITRPAGKALVPKGSLGFSFGEFGTHRQRSELSGALGPVKYFAAGSNVTSGGFRPHSDVSEQRVFMKVEAPFLEDWRAMGSFGYSGSKVNEFDVPFPTFLARLDRKTYQRYGSAGLIHEKDNRRSEISYKISERSFRRDTEILPATPFSFVKAKSLIHEISTKGVWTIGENQTFVLGSDIAVDVFNTVTISGSPTNIRKTATRHAYYANYQLSWEFIDLSLGSRLDATNSYGVHFDPSVGLNIHLPFWQGVISANVSRAFNEPSLSNRYLSAGTTIANPDLLAEHAIVYNLGLEVTPHEKVTSKAVFFQTHLENSVQTIRRSDLLFQAVNIGSERRTGFDIETELGPWYGFSGSYGMAYVKAVQPGKGFVQTRPHFTQDVKVNFFKQYKEFKLNIHLAGRYTDLTLFAGVPAIDQVFIFDGKIVLTFPEVIYGNLSVFLEGENLFNEDFAFNSTTDTNPQRNFEAGVKFLF